MRKSVSRLEDLPNELLTDVFKNLDARDLFRAFSHLNARFNCLIRSFGYLQLRCHLADALSIKLNEEYFPFYVHTLIVDPWTNFPLYRFVNVRRLILTGPLPQILVQLKADAMPYLEHLSVIYSYAMYEIVVLHEKIFSNTFLRLSSCELIENNTVTTLPNCHVCPTINKLKLSYIDARIFLLILNNCPNLTHFEFTLSFTPITGDFALSHSNLRYLTIELTGEDWSYDDYLLGQYIRCVPHLEHFTVLRRSYSKILELYLEQYDWLATMIEQCFIQLRSFRYAIRLKKDDGFFNAKHQQQCQDNFQRSHPDIYRTRLIFLDPK